jgi:hypothetical protein
MPVCGQLVAWRRAGSTDAWSASDATTSPFNLDKFLTRVIYIHTAVMSGLDSGTDYEYQVGHWLSWSSTRTFSGRTPGLLDASPLDLAIFGDWGIAPYGSDTRTLLDALQP